MFHVLVRTTSLWPKRKEVGTLASPIRGQESCIEKLGYPISDLFVKWFSLSSQRNRIARNRRRESVSSGTSILDLCGPLNYYQ
ncbi:hypothetical protein AVEN_158973-1 [Araneus ventricosus]|uniref:Uncharacterized protein n=1 Tax=Araneus ventricosus TaxID=182803 RepID=A0A4Y2BC52_ARAVE|nr:hypothetical protein AVEN_158973-1 [Araneus ventricosus]